MCFSFTQLMDTFPLLVKALSSCHNSTINIRRANDYKYRLKFMRSIFVLEIIKYMKNVNKNSLVMLSPMITYNNVARSAA